MSRIEPRDLHDRAIVAHARTLQQRLDDLQRERRFRLWIRDKIDRVVVRPRELLRDSHLGAADEFLLRSSLERPFVLLEAARAAGGQRVTDRVVGAVEFPLNIRVRIEGTFCLEDAGFADERQIAEDADLAGVAQRAAAVPEPARAPCDRL